MCPPLLPRPAPGPLLEARNLVKAYRGRRVVNGVSFHVCRGEIVGLLGPNGAGKTTSFRMTVGLTAPDAGRSARGPRVLAPADVQARAPGHGLPAAGAEHLPAHEGARQPAGGARGHAARAPRAPRGAPTSSCPSSISATSPHNLADTLSGGERRRLEIARALASDPSILCSTSPSPASTRSRSRRSRRSSWRLRQRHLGILITDHNVRETLHSTDRAYIIHQGRILREGTATQLVEDPKVREVYLGHASTRACAAASRPRKSAAVAEP
jgi:lipopolysaccharide export system ATP-binding protein